MSEYINTVDRDKQDRQGRIRTFTGVYVNPLAMRSKDVRIDDIAHHLSLITRYTGACPYHYSVAQHSVIVARKLIKDNQPYSMVLVGLLHDAAEYVFNDIASPVKHDPRMKWYADLEHETCRMILATLGADPDLLPAVKYADDYAFRCEVGAWWNNENGPVGKWSARQAKEEFLDLYFELKRRLQ